ncbi:hypothetical protein EVAR_14445_1 [Eumeta japonica]|uniref:Uncharacterized protein n=1 Tax=Eumeta variegata TaxID=151549 RepID=A0A4C1TXB3_EUMVA|nr:hypothetical protein EVAR_14445_1 [Eumeta japonica]
MHALRYHACRRGRPARKENGLAIAALGERFPSLRCEDAASPAKIARFVLRASAPSRAAARPDAGSPITRRVTALDELLIRFSVCTFNALFEYLDSPQPRLCGTAPFESVKSRYFGSTMSKGHKDMTIPDKNPYGTRRSSRRETLEDLKSLLEDRGPKNVKSPSKNKETNEDEKQFIRNVLEIDKIDKVNSRLKDLADKGELANYLSGCKGNNDNTSSLKCKDNKPVRDGGLVFKGIIIQNRRSEFDPNNRQIKHVKPSVPDVVIVLVTPVDEGRSRSVWRA